MRDPRLVLLEKIAKNVYFRKALNLESILLMSHECPQKGKRPVHGPSRKRWLDEIMKTFQQTTVQTGRNERYVQGPELRMAKFYRPTFN